MPNLNNVPTLPPYLLERLSACYSQEQTDRICAGYAAQRAVSFRVNTLKAAVPAVLEQLQTAGIATIRLHGVKLPFSVRIPPQKHSCKPCLAMKTGKSTCKVFPQCCRRLCCSRSQNRKF